MSKHSKGTHYELEARKLLEAEGFFCEKKNYNRWASKDFYGQFDILAIGKYTRLIQIKTNISDFYKARKSIAFWLVGKIINNVVFEVWVREPRKEWRIETISPIND